MPAGRLQAPKLSPKLSTNPGKAKCHCYNHIFSTELSTLVVPLIPCMPYQ